MFTFDINETIYILMYVGFSMFYSNTKEWSCHEIQKHYSLLLQNKYVVLRLGYEMFVECISLAIGCRDYKKTK